MTPETIEQDFREKVSKEICLASEGVARYRVSSPFTLEDGDHLVIVLKREADRWVLSDEGHTYMHLTYDVDERDLLRGTRQKIITNALSAFKVEDRDGELVLAVEDERFGDALYSFVQAILRITDVTYLTRERTRSAFVEDFRHLINEIVPEERREFDWHDPVHDPQGMYSVDCRINGMDEPLYMFALAGDDRTRDATIALLQFERWGIAAPSVGIFEDQETIGRRVLARFTDVCGKQFSAIGTNRDRIERYIKEMLGKR